MIDGHVKILGIPIFSGNKRKVLEILWSRIGSRGDGTDPDIFVVFTPNSEQIVMAQEDKIFSSTLQRADLNCADTIGVVVADWLRAKKERREWKVKERSPGIDVAWEIALWTLKAGKKVFLVGGKGDVAHKAAQRLTSRMRARFYVQKKQEPEVNRAPGTVDLELLGWDEGAHDITHETVEERERVLNKISEFKPDLVLVAYGAPWQEQWVMENKAALAATNVKVVMVVGGSFDVWGGNLPRAPLPIRKIGLEWLWRLMIEPWRWKRQLGLVQFIFLTLKRT